MKQIKKKELYAQQTKEAEIKSNNDIKMAHDSASVEIARILSEKASKIAKFNAETEAAHVKILKKKYKQHRRNYRTHL